MALFGSKCTKIPFSLKKRLPTIPELCSSLKLITPLVHYIHSARYLKKKAKTSFHPKALKTNPTMQKYAGYFEVTPQSHWGSVKIAG